jgi:hypothetical protein
MAKNNAAHDKADYLFTTTALQLLVASLPDGQPKITAEK